jgi:hypothetical protein
MMQNGVRAERQLLDDLEKLGFRLRRANNGLDEIHKIDAIIHAPPLLEGEYWFPPSIGLQVTLRREDIAKRTEFVRKAGRVTPRLVYLEIASNEVTPGISRAAATALASMFYDDGPKDRLIVVGENFFEAFDLQGEDNLVRRWLETKLAGPIEGTIVRWNKDGGYGFIEARVAGPDDSHIDAEFYFRGQNVPDRSLRDRLKAFDGNIPKQDRPRVIFQDGAVKGDQKNKTAINVRPVTIA